MKLSSVRVKRTLDQLEEQSTFRDTQVIPDDNPAVPQLNELFGDHTFFLDSGGLHIIEPADAAPQGARLGKVVKLASWRDAQQSGLKPHKPQPTDIVVVLGTEEKSEDDPNSAA